MLPIYDQLTFQEIIEKGGRTKPWIIKVNTPRGLKNYVVKLFNEEEVEKNAISNEVFGSILARQFELNVPEPALFIFNDDFIKTLDDKCWQIVEERHKGVKFGCELLEGALLFDPKMRKNVANKIVDIDTIFAFDNLINNSDRNNHKPNLLVHHNEGYLIDHELGFSSKQKNFSNLDEWNPSERNKWHIFYNYLKRSRVKTKKKYFQTFVEYLRVLNITILDTYAAQLLDNDLQINNYNSIIKFLGQVKSNPTRFVNLLKNIIK
ncbi:MAG: hypothetical protein MI921_08435 [Cytophagales bacterium]|nr:hypothetical protein [Cytophagales bacterium]